MHSSAGVGVCLSMCVCAFFEDDASALDRWNSAHSCNSLCIHVYDVCTSDACACTAWHVSVCAACVRVCVCVCGMCAYADYKGGKTVVGDGWNEGQMSGLFFYPRSLQPHEITDIINSGATLEEWPHDFRDIYAQRLLLHKAIEKTPPLDTQ